MIKQQQKKTFLSGDLMSSSEIFLFQHSTGCTKKMFLVANDGDDLW